MRWVDAVSVVPHQQVEQLARVIQKVLPRGFEVVLLLFPSDLAFLLSHDDLPVLLDVVGVEDDHARERDLDCQGRRAERLDFDEVLLFEFLDLNECEFERPVGVSDGGLGLGSELACFFLGLRCFGLFASDDLLGFLGVSSIDLELLHQFERLDAGFFELGLHFLQDDLDLLDCSVCGNEFVKPSF